MLSKTLKALGLALFLFGISLQSKAAWNQQQECSGGHDVAWLVLVAVCASVLVVSASIAAIVFMRHVSHRDYIARKRNHPR
ncbi:MAG: hypothetical protein PHE17_19510 [Thiothrix sp.]|uniref:hypothetical protein n=1 Tax=Thiothrix sp. TaxID=1032 RepID=UPI00261680CE|nr:hypothetical protein [Thiothrix sp.]MDD5395216.1 hypothetical protein [Thiothrix sp.]